MIDINFELNYYASYCWNETEILEGREHSSKAKSANWLIPAAKMRKLLFSASKLFNYRRKAQRFSFFTDRRFSSFVNFSSSSSSKFDFNSVSEASLNNLLERMEAKEHFLPSTFDAEYSQGVLTIKFYSEAIDVLNKQPPNQQIWLSSPFSGPRRFEWNSELFSWRDVRNSEIELIEFLQTEFSKYLKFEL